MKAHEHLAGNLKRYLDSNLISTNSIASKKDVSQKTIWVCANGTVNASLNVAHKVSRAMELDAFMLCRKQFTEPQIRRSTTVGIIADKLMTLDRKQLQKVNRLINEMEID
jgi:DNA-binding XRE family transcriptional regulator